MTSLSRRRLAASRRARDRRIRLIGGEPLEARVMLSGAGSRALAGAPPLEASLFGDVNGDGPVDRRDLGAIRASLGRLAGQPGDRTGIDLNGDGRITPRDLLLARRNLGATRWTSSVFQTPGTPDQAMSVSFTLTERESDYRNEVGLFVVDDAGGRIGGLYPGDPGYAAAALSGGRRRTLFTRAHEAGSSCPAPRISAPT